MRYACLRIVGGSIAAIAMLGVAPALAYVGPGAGLTLLGALWGLIAAIVMTVGFVLLWPLRRFLLTRRDKAKGAASMDDEAMDDSSMLANPSDRDNR